MTNPDSRSWGVDLDRLDDERAEFRFPAHGTTVGLSRADWEAIGSPTTIWITPRGTGQEDSS